MNGDPLTELRDIHLPPPPGWWPPAPGWWLLLLLAALALVIGVIWLDRQQRRRAPGRQALRELAALHACAAQAQLVGVNRLLRRAARLQFGQDCASLPPAQWGQFLSQHSPADIAPERWQVLAEAPYRPTPPARPQEFLRDAELWLQRNLPC